MSYSQKQFDEALAAMLEQAAKTGKSSLRVVSKELHDRVIGDGQSHKMTMACASMWKMHKKTGGEIIHATPDGEDLALEIEFPLDEAAAPEAEAGMPVLAVDLDGTLVRTDMGMETFWSAFANNWAAPFIALSVLLGRGWPAMKGRIRAMADIDFASLPYNHSVIEYVKAWRNKGGKTALVTASNEHIADAVAAELGIFDEAHGSDEKLNLKGKHKADFLEQRFGREPGFAYMGDAMVDIPVWSKAQKAIIVNASPLVRARAEAVSGNIEHISEAAADIKVWFKAVRVHQWLKNALLFLPMLLAHRFDMVTIGATILAVLVFSLIASSVYLMNDLLDLRADRLHLRKRHRPLAAGRVSIIHATILPFMLLPIAFALATNLGPDFCLTAACYYVVTVFYSLLWKRYPVIDICVLAGLYTLRIVAGGMATGIALSAWLVMFSVFFFFSLAVVKRQAELTENSIAERRGYKSTDMPVITGMALASGYISVLVMALYIDSVAVRMQYDSPQLLWGVCPILLFWISRTVLSAHRGEIREDPVLYFAGDRTSYICAIGIVGFAIAAAIL